MELSVLNIAGQETGRKIVLDDAIFGIQPNEHAIYLDVKQFLANKKLKKLARKSALAVKASANAVKVVEDFTFEAPKTKQMVALMNNLQVNNGRLLLVLGNGVNENVLLSARNLQNVEVMRVSDIATYNVMKAKNLVLVESSVEGLNEMFNLN